MEENGSSALEGIGNAIRKKRSYTFRRPRPESQSSCDISPLSSTPLSDDVVAGSSDENNGGDHSSRRKELSLTQCASRFPDTSRRDDEKPVKKSEKMDIGLDELYGSCDLRGTNHKRNSSEGALAPANRKNPSKSKQGSEPQKTMALNDGKSGGASISAVEGLGNENKVKKVKLKVGGVTRTIDANSSFKADTTVQRLKFVHKGNTNNETPSTTYKRGGLQGIPWKDFSRGGFSLGREESSMAKGKNNGGKQGDKGDPVQQRKSKRAPKKRSRRDGFDDDVEDDDEIRYLEKLKNAKFSAAFDDEDDEDSSTKHRRLSKLSGSNSQDVKKCEGIEYEEEEGASEDEADGIKKKKKARKDSVESAVEPTKRELSLTTRQRALQSGTDTSSPSRNGVEFPNGLPPPPPRKQKEQLSEVEQQLRKAEIAQRRKMQNEKAARESEAEAIRKILGQDTNRKKRQEKKKKRGEELALEKAAEELWRVSNSIRWVDGPNGVSVTFPKDMGFPSIFNSKCRYPPPRETCAGPSCKNPYKYRDSKTRLPLCSLECYKAVQQGEPAN